MIAPQSGDESLGAKIRCAKLDELQGRTTCSFDQAAEILGIGRSTAFAAAHDGSLPTLRLSHRLLVPVAKLRVMLGLDDEPSPRT